jgi:hypothetical protein
LEKNIEKFARLGHRLSGSTNSYHAVNIIREQFERYGFETTLEPVRVRGNLTYRFILNLLLLLFIYLLLSNFYILSLILYGIIFISFWGELTFSFHLLRPLIPVHPSANIEAKLNKRDKSGKRIIVVDHHDSPRTGFLFKLSDRLVPAVLNYPAPLNRYIFLPFLAVLIPGISLLIRPLLGSGKIDMLLVVFSLVPVILLLIVFIQMAYSAPSPGANDNASGVLVLLELARRFSVRKPVNVSVNLLATGAEEMGFFGIKHYLKAHQELDRQETIFINLECVGEGKLYWTTGEEHLLKISYKKKGIELIDHFEKAGIIPAISRTAIISPTDAGVITRSGYHVLTLIGLKDSRVPLNYHTSGDTFDKLDRNVIRQVADIVETIVRNYK